MPDVEIRPFSDEHLGSAAELLGARHELHRAAEVNLLASRFWPRRGFRPAFFRLYRHIP